MEDNMWYVIGTATFALIACLILAIKMAKLTEDPYYTENGGQTCLPY